MDADQNKTTVIRGGIGVFYDNVPLNTYAFSSYPQQTVTMYNSSGVLIGSLIQYIDLTQQAAESKFPFIDSAHKNGNFAPYTVGWNVELDRSFSTFITALLNPGAVYSLLTDYRVNARLLIIVPALLIGEILLDSHFQLCRPVTSVCAQIQMPLPGFEVSLQSKPLNLAKIVEHENCKFCADQLVRLVFENLLRCLIDEQNEAALVHPKDRIGSGFRDTTKALFAFL
jgi:hypothetical protein